MSCEPISKEVFMKEAIMNPSLGIAQNRRFSVVCVTIAILGAMYVPYLLLIAILGMDSFNSSMLLEAVKFAFDGYPLLVILLLLDVKVGDPVEPYVWLINSALFCGSVILARRDIRWLTSISIMILLLSICNGLIFYCLCTAVFVDLD